mgnify:CR=1 FL=1
MSFLAGFMLAFLGSFVLVPLALAVAGVVLVAWMVSRWRAVGRDGRVAAAVLSARFIAETEVEWQSRVQWSTLLVRKAPRIIRMNR